jgi:mannosyltransferase OCH1-like enzyme
MILPGIEVSIITSGWLSKNWENLMKLKRPLDHLIWKNIWNTINHFLLLYGFSKVALIEISHRFDHVPPLGPQVLTSKETCKNEDLNEGPHILRSVLSSFHDI